MTDTAILIAQRLAAAASILLMGVFGLGLLRRLTRLILGKETADGPRKIIRTGRRAYMTQLTLVFAAAVASRLLIYLIAWAMHRAGGWSGGFLETLEPLWSRWDTRHYVSIAQSGYVNAGDERLQIVFFPLLPWLMRLLAPITGGSEFAAGLLVSLLCTGGAAALLFDLTALHDGVRRARLAVGYLLLSPMSVFLGCCYTEALFMCLTLAAMCLLRRGHPWLAALCGMGCALTRMPGVIVAGLFIIALLEKIPRRAFTPRAVMACVGQVLVVFAGLFIYWGINWAVTGDPLRYMVYQRENWFQRPGTFWGSVSNTVYYMLGSAVNEEWLFSWFSQFIAMFIVFALFAYGAGKLPFDLAAYSFVYIAVVLSPTWLLSGPRYLFALAPLHMLKARCARSRGAHIAGLIVSAAALLVFIYGYAIAVEVL
ncbi:MAG: hypothetical protein J6M47_07600 [Clostridia bacterium]|nr:hypothetical protein [Clostridia bacterium]